MLDPVLRDDLDHHVKAHEAELIAFRRTLHAHPELGRQEHRTTAAIVSRLLEAGLEPRVLSTGTGVICDIVGALGEQPTIAFRGDIDALPLVDEKDVPYRSTVDGACHACGHDAHTAVALGTALVLAEMAEAGHLQRSVRVIFQPAEELSPGGALDVLSDGELDGIEHAFAIHCDPKILVGQVGFRSGPITSAADRIRVSLTGPGGHTARPHLTADLVYALGAVVTELPALLSRRADPRSGLSLVWGQVHAGATGNAIPQSGFAEGTIRCLDVGTWEAAHTIVPDLAQKIVEPFGVGVEVEVRVAVPPCVNDVAEIERIRTAAFDVLGPAAITTTDQSLGGEDFAWILDRVPGALVRLGVRRTDVADGGDLHRGTFDIDEAAISVGVRLFSGLALSLPTA